MQNIPTFCRDICDAALPEKSSEIKSWNFVICSSDWWRLPPSWNYIFSDIQLLCKRLEKLDIEAMMEADNE